MWRTCLNGDRERSTYIEDGEERLEVDGAVCSREEDMR